MYVTSKAVNSTMWKVGYKNPYTDQRFAKANIATHRPTIFIFAYITNYLKPIVNPAYNA
jgi:hypothetical protein